MKEEILKRLNNKIKKFNITYSDIAQKVSDTWDRQKVWNILKGNRYVTFENLEAIEKAIAEIEKERGVL